METKVTAPKDWLREIEVEIEPDRLKAEVDRQLDSYQERAEVPGFRKGKVPRAVLAKRLGEAIEQAATQELVEQTSQEVLGGQEFRPAATPQLVDLEVTPEKVIRYKLRLEIFPVFELKTYKGIEVTKHEPSGFEEEFEKRLAQLQDKCATFKAVTGAAADGHFVAVDYSTYEGDKQVAEPKSNLMLQVGDAMNFEEVNRDMVGAKAGDEKGIAVRIPENHPDKDMAGKEVTFKFKVHEVKEKNIPSVDEDFALDLGYDDLDALRQDINDSIMRDRDRLIQNDLKNQVFDHMLAEHQFEPPETWVQANLERLRREYELPDDEETTKKLTEVAVRRARFDIIAARVSGEENIEVTEQEIGSQVEAMATSLKKPVEDIAPLLDNPAFRSQMLRDKVMDFVLKEAKVKNDSAAAKPGKKQKPKEASGKKE